MRTGFVVVIQLAACGGGGGDGGDLDAAVNASAHQFCVQETNRYRAMNSRPALARSAQLESYADLGAMIDFNGSPHEHFSSTNGGGIAFAENECPQWDITRQGGGDLNRLVGACIAAFYSEGPGTGADHGHYINMMGDYDSLGCGIYQSGSDVTIVQDYGP